MNEVLVVGAGPTGLVLTAELLKRNIPVCLIEKNEGPSEFSRALGIQARTLEIFEKMGIIEPFLQKGLCAQELFFHYDGKTHSLKIEGIDSPYPFTLLLSQEETESILRDHVRKLNGNIFWGTTFIGFENDCALLDHKGTIEKKKFSYVIGCDGAHSSVRHALKVAFRGKKLKESFLLADVTFDPPLEYIGPNIFFSEKGLTFIVPFNKEKKFRIIFPLHSDENSFFVENDNKKNIDEMLIKKGWKEKHKISSIHWISHFTIHRRIVQSFRKNTIFLAGDAAHVHSPAGGQGMNTSIHDAYNLSWKLASVIQNISPPTLLDTYEEERKPIAQSVLKGTTFATHLVAFCQKKRFFLFLFPLLAHLLKRKKMRAFIGKSASETAIRYQSSIVKSFLRDAFWKGPKSGERMPEVILENGEKLFSLFPPLNCVLLLFEPNTHFKEKKGLSIVVTKDKNVREKLRADQKSCYIIRPDGYIGLRSRKYKEKEVDDYLLKLFY